MLRVVDLKNRTFSGSFIRIQVLLNREFDATKDDNVSFLFFERLEERKVEKSGPFGRTHDVSEWVLSGWERRSASKYCSDKGFQLIVNLNVDGGKYAQLWATPLLTDPSTWYPMGPPWVMGPGSSGNLCY